MRPNFCAVSAFVSLSLLSLLAPGAAARAVAVRSPLTIPAVALVDAYPFDRSMVVSIVKGAVTPSDEGFVGLAGLHLPQGAQIEALAATAIDESTPGGLEVRIFRRRIGTAILTGDALALLTTSGNSPALQAPRTEAVTEGTVDNGRYVYWIAARLVENVELFAIQVEFLLPLLVDGFESADTAEWNGVAEDGYVSPWVVNFADARPTTLNGNACHYLGFNGSSAEAYLSAQVTTGGSCCFVAPVHLPDGVEVSSVFFYVGDDGPLDYTLSLRRKRIATTTLAEVMGSATTFGTGNNVRLFADGTIEHGLVDNGLYTYFVSSDTCLEEGEDEMSFFQALVFYEE